MTNKIRNCCSAGKKSKKCVRTSDKKVFNLPRRFSRKKCTSGKIKGFTMRASCAAYKDCKKGGSAKKIKGGRFDRHRHIEKDTYEEALERPQMEFPLTDDAFYEHSSSYDLNQNVPDVSINLDDSSLFSNLEDTISLNDLPEDPNEIMTIHSDIDEYDQIFENPPSPIHSQRGINEYDEIFENPPSPIRRQRGGKSKRKGRSKRRRKRTKRYTRKGSDDEKTGGAPINPLHKDDLESKIIRSDPNFDIIKDLVKDSAAGIFYLHETIRKNRPMNKPKTIEAIRSYIILLVTELAAQHSQRGYDMKEVQDVVKKLMNKLFDEYDPRKLKFEQHDREYILEAVNEAASFQGLFKEKDMENMLKKREERNKKEADEFRKKYGHLLGPRKKKEVVEAAGGPPVSENDSSSDESERGSISDTSSSEYYTPRASISGIEGETNPDDLINEARNIPKESLGKKLCSKLNPLNCIRSSKKNRSDLEQNLLGGKKITRKRTKRYTRKKK
jgi:hypothetical protein